LKEYWRRADAIEHQQLIDTNTIETVPNGNIHGRERAIGSTMIYKFKFQEDGITINKFKARLVALGFMQIAGTHYNKDACSAPVARSCRSASRINSQTYVLPTKRALLCYYTYNSNTHPKQRCEKCSDTDILTRLM